MTVKRTKRKYMHRKQNSGINHLQAVQSVKLNLGFGVGLESWYLWSCKKVLVLIKTLGFVLDQWSWVFTSKKNEKFPYKINIQIQGRMITFNAAVSVFPVLVLFLDFFGFGLGISGLVAITEQATVVVQKPAVSLSQFTQNKTPAVGAYCYRL